MSNVDVLLSRLERVKAVGRDRWLARCPSHDDRSPSLNIRALDGRVLLHCFAGCNTGDVLQAVGLSWRDVFPPQSEAEREQFKREARAARAAKQARSDRLLIAQATADLERGIELTPDDLRALREAIARQQRGATDA